MDSPKDYQQIIRNYTDELFRAEQRIQALQEENAALNEQIFDYQQQMVSFNLQVDQRVEQVLAQNDQTKKNMLYLQKIQQLNNQINYLSQQIQLGSTQQIRNKQIYLQQKQHEIQARQKDILQRQKALMRKWQQLDTQKSELNKRQSQIFKRQSELNIRQQYLQMKEKQLKNRKDQNYYQQKIEQSRHNRKQTYKQQQYTTPVSKRNPNFFTMSQVQPSEDTHKYKLDNYKSHENKRSLSRQREQLKSFTYHRKPQMVTVSSSKLNKFTSDFKGESQNQFSKASNINNLATWRQDKMNNLEGTGSRLNSRAKSGNLLNIQSKLERLKQEIRQEIDMIK